MAATIRLTRKGRNKKPFYRIVVTDSRSPRDGRFIEILGTFDPLTDPATVQLKAEKAKDWIGRGVKISDTVREIFKKEGIFSQGTPDTKQSG